MTRLIARARHQRGEEGVALELALIFLAATAVIVGALLTFASGSSQAQVATRVVRGSDYDTDSYMQAAIATIRVNAAVGTVSSCPSMGAAAFPTLVLNTPSRPIRVDCVAFPTTGAQRRVILTVCPAAIVPTCQEGQSLLRADVSIFDDGGTIGRAISISSWSNQ